MTERTSELWRAWREAVEQEEIARPERADAIRRYGRCTRGRGHFDGASAFFGAVLAAAAEYLVWLLVAWANGWMH